MVTDAPGYPKLRRSRARARCAQIALALVAGAAHGAACAQSLAAKARESGCIDAPRVVEGRTYRCNTVSGAAAYFNLVPADNAGGETAVPKRSGSATGHVPSPATSFPKVDATTQRNRDDMRRRVLGDELAAEEKLLAESRAAYANGAPPALPDEQSNPQKYAERIARLRQAVTLHERNIEALRKELSIVR